MKKSKKKAANADGASLEAVDIAPEALANLADRLKLDLGKPQIQSGNQKKGGKKDKEGMNDARDKPRKEKSSSTEFNHAPKQIQQPKPEKPKTTADKKNESVLQGKKEAKLTANKDGAPKLKSIPPKQPNQRKGDAKVNGSHNSSTPFKSPAQSISNTPSSDKRQRKPDAKPSEIAPSLLDEILALGGTKEDLELVEDIDTDEDVEGDSQPTGKPKATGRNDQSLQQELQSQLKSLGLTGTFLDEDSDDEELAGPSDWTDESESSPLPKSTQKQAPPKAVELQPRTIDRPVQLSTPAKSESRKPGLQKHHQLKLEPHSLWYAIERPPAHATATIPNAEIISHLHARGKVLLQTESDNYINSNHITSADRQFLSTIMTSGTQTDKLSALTLSISSSPLHCTKQLDALLGMAKKKSRNEAVQAVAALKDLLIGNLLPDRKLVYFGKQVGLSSHAKDEELLLWTFEDWLKGWYFQVLQVIEALAMDPLSFVRNHMISYILELLRDKPEQEQLLLRLLVNKLGDSSKKIAAKTSYFLLQVEATHPQMKSIVLHEMENLLFRPNTSIHAQYYTIITMNQTILSSRDIPVANRLVEVYFMLFVKLLRAGVKETKPEPKKKVKGVKKKRGAVDWEELNQQEEEVNSKILSAVLTGVNRAFPFSKVESDVFEKHMDVLFMITHDANFNTAIQALILIHQVVSTKQIVLDRFYRTLYESLLDQRLATSSKQVLYLNLLFKALKSDINIPRVKAFIKRIVQITSMHSPGFTCGVLFLLAELTTSRPELKTLWSPSSQPSEYDAHKRDPMHANAESSSLWELSPLLLHFHPTVQLYAENLLHPQPNTTKPDLALHTVKHFLDRFVYRNPKTKGTTRGASIMQPLPGTDTSLVLNVRGAAKTEKAVNSEEWWRQQVDRVKPDEVFFHRFFVGKEEKEVRAMGKKRKRGDDDEELGEDEIWEALVKSSREEGGEGDVDVDGSDDDSVDWSEDDDDEIDDEMVQEMNEGESESEMSQSEDLSVEGLDEDQEDISAEEGDLNDFFDDEAEEVDDDDEMGDVSDEEESSVDSDDADGVDGRFEFGDSASDIVDSDEDAPAVVQETNADRSKKRKLKSLPTFAAAEDYAHLLDD